MIVNGLTELEDLEDLIPVTFDKEDYETLNGFLIDKLEHIPGEDETCVVDYDGYRFTVLQIDNNIIQTVKIEKFSKRDRIDNVCNNTILKKIKTNR